MDFQFKTSLKQILILVEYFQIEYQIVAAQEIWPQRGIVVVVGPEHVLRVPVLRNDRRGMEETSAEVNVEESVQVVYLHIEKV